MESKGCNEVVLGFISIAVGLQLLSVGGSAGLSSDFPLNIFFIVLLFYFFCE